MNPLKAFVLFIGVIAAFGLGLFVGAEVATMKIRAQVLSGPYSDDFKPALTAVAAAKAKLQSGETNVMEELKTIQAHLENAEAWASGFLGEPDSPANGSQPFRSETNQTPSAAGSRR